MPTGSEIRGARFFRLVEPEADAGTATTTANAREPTDDVKTRSTLAEWR
jgi:hypothetical protein